MWIWDDNIQFEAGELDKIKASARAKGILDDNDYLTNGHTHDDFIKHSAGYARYGNPNTSGSGLEALIAFGGLVLFAGYQAAKIYFSSEKK